ncbi:MAG: hypothetical protein Tp172MES00d2C118482111_12 [Prokaryotic dsDNA virus sp.]|nr:MAG: hypothetical protein Tp172MES00d2C118482111_12 [Prokaryotic dsDNA virus sp.]
MVYEAFDEEDGLRSQIKEDVKTELKLAVFQVFAAIGITIIVSIISIAIYLANLRSDVDDLLQFADSGERFTQTDGRLLEQQIEGNTDALKEVARRDDLQRVEETLIRLDERLRNSGM